MEFKDEHEFFEELVWEAIPAAVTGGDFFSAHLQDFYDYSAAAAPSATFLSASPSSSSPGGGLSAAPAAEQGLFGYPGAELCCPFGNAFSALDVADAPVAAAQGGWQAPVEEQRGCPETADAFKSEAEQCPKTAVFGAGRCPDGRGKRAEGQPSKNLMAERRRRKRLNDRLSMLRSIVPKISKMDRTSILGDTIDYMKELLDKINSLEEGSEADSGRPEAKKSVTEQLKSGDPPFAVERRDSGARIEICCAGKPGMLLSTVTTLEALGLEIEQCVVSCFNDFALRASCSEDLEQRRVISCEDIKQALFRNAGYGGSCL